jgi:hypothetical protein
MLLYSRHMITRCAIDARLRYGEQTETLVQRQIGWSEARGAAEEVAFWQAVRNSLAPQATGAGRRRVRLTLRH